MTDERSGPFFPNLYIAGDKSGQKPQTVPDVHLPGQITRFSGRSSFNPFTHAVSAVFNEDLTDSWGTGFAVHGVNNLGLDVKNNYPQYSDIVLGRNDAQYQPFITALSAGAEYDLIKIREVAGHLNLPLPGINEIFDLDGRIMLKGYGNGVLQSTLDFPLTLSDPAERAPFNFKYLNFMADRHMQYGQLRNRPRGLGLLKLPTGMTDERSGPFFPNLYIAGDKSGQKPQTIPDLHLPGQETHFSGKTAFNPFTQAVSAVFTEDLSDAWGTGFGVHGVNTYGLNVRDNYHKFSDAVLGRNDASYQPFILGFTTGGEYDFIKIREVSGHLDLPIPGINEVFDLDGSIMLKGNGNGVLNSHLDFPLLLSDPKERAPFNFKYLNFMADRHMHYGHVLPNVNLFLLRRQDIMNRLVQNKANPTTVG
uniref:TonB_dep_Rec domain-containing protein n=1 Tax=Syphacia muris TaxID=451379 RepID=A0A0N5AP21_9BILA